MVNSKQFIFERINKDIREQIGVVDEAANMVVAERWANDKNNPSNVRRYKVIKKFSPHAKKVLDMASGVGTFVFHGLLNGYEVYGVDPEDWKMDLIRMKIKEFSYPEQWADNFVKAFGEELPFEDNFFDFSSTYQTLEHVQDYAKCLDEMVRVTKEGGALHICCPDYRSAYEAHYCISWLPLCPRWLGNIYLRLRGRNPYYLTTILYVTQPKIERAFREIEKKRGVKLEIIDLNKEEFLALLKAKDKMHFARFYPLYRSYQYLKVFLRAELSVALLVKIVNKEQLDI